VSTLTTKGQVTVPKALRDRLGLAAGSLVEFDINETGEVVLRPAQPARRKTAAQAASAYRRILESVRGSADKRFASTDEYMKFVRG
jgi:antitoxin PrlF